MTATIIHGNNLDILPTLDDCSIDAIVTDPPYELGFMGKRWDASGIAYNVTLWQECLRVLKPGGHLLAFGGTRTYHRMACAIEDAGFEIRDSIHYMYGSGFPKSLNVTKALKDKACTCEINWSYGSGQAVSEHDMRSMPNADIPETINAQESSGQVLLKSVQEPNPQIIRFQGDQPETGWTEQSSMEGRGDLRQGQRQLPGAEICEMPEGFSGDGSKRRVHHGASFGDGSMDGQATGSLGSGKSHQSQSEGQSSGESRTVSEQWRSQTRGSWPVCGRCSKPIVPVGLGTSLKPAHEPIVVARKPLVGTVASNVLEFGTGAINIDASRIAGDMSGGFWNYVTKKVGYEGGWNSMSKPNLEPHHAGRWPANVILTHTEDCTDECVPGCPVALLDGQSGTSKDGVAVRRNGNQAKGLFGVKIAEGSADVGYGGSGGASRFFYCAKPSRKERNAGLDHLEKKQGGSMTGAEYRPDRPTNHPVRENHHPTVKPLALMRYLVRLVTPPGGTVLDPFAGSGTTLMAAILEGFTPIGIEMTDEYLPIIQGRVAWAEQQAANIPDQQELDL